MERREIAGIILIAVIASTVVTYHLQRASELPFQVLEEKMPEALPAGEETSHEISASLVLRQDVESLIIDFDSLANATSDKDLTAGVEEAIEICVRLLDAIDAPYDKEDLELDGGQGIMYDFSPAFAGIAPKLATISATTVYSVIEIDGRKNAYRGVSDFFPNRNRSLASITLSKNEVPETYLTEQAGRAQAQGQPSVMEAPLLGRKEFTGNKEDDRVSARLVVSSIGVPGHRGMMQVLRIYADDQVRLSKGYILPVS